MILCTPEQLYAFELPRLVAKPLAEISKSTSSSSSSSSAQHCPQYRAVRTPAALHQILTRYAVLRSTHTHTHFLYAASTTRVDGFFAAVGTHAHIHKYAYTFTCTPINAQLCIKHLLFECALR